MGILGYLALTFELKNDILGNNLLGIQEVDKCE